MRHYSDAELDSFATPLSIHLERAAHAKDANPIGWIVEQMDQECTVIYDSYLQWVALLQTFISRCTNEAKAIDATVEQGNFAFREFVAQYKGLTFRQRVEKVAQRLRASGSTFEVLEDDREIRFILSRWGAARLNLSQEPRSASGRRIMYPTYDAYTAPTEFVRFARNAVTGGMDNLPCFLSTEFLFLETIAIEMMGAPIAEIAMPDGPDRAIELRMPKSGSFPREVFERADFAVPEEPQSSAANGRIFTEEQLDRLATPLSIQVSEAATAGDWALLAEISAGMDEELVIAKDPLGILINGLLSWIARHLGEAVAIEALEKTADYVMAPYISWVAEVSPVDAIPLWAMVWRAHGSTMWIEEEADRFVFRGRPLGACARMSASRYAPQVERISPSRVRYPTFGSNMAPMCAHMLREPHPVNHYTSGFPVYSAHCTMLHEIFPIDQLGRPLWVEEHALEDPDGETIHYHYKDASAWPERFYEQVGRKKSQVIQAGR